MNPKLNHSVVATANNSPLSLRSGRFLRLALSTMSARWTNLAALFVLMAGVLPGGCKRQDCDTISIMLKKGTYEKWLQEQRPALATLPKSAIIDGDFATYENGTTVLPVIEYHLKAGDWDGILELYVILALDGQGKPIGMHEETVTFIRLPAKNIVTGKGGKPRNEYYGLKLEPVEAAAAIRRLIAGEDFDDYRQRVDESGDFAHSLFDDNDPWKSLRKQ